MKTKCSALERTDDTDLLKGCPQMTWGPQWEEGTGPGGSGGVPSLLPLPVLWTQLVDGNGWEEWGRQVEILAKLLPVQQAGGSLSLSHSPGGSGGARVHDEAPKGTKWGTQGSISGRLPPWSSPAEPGRVFWQRVLVFQKHFLIYSHLLIMPPRRLGQGPGIAHGHG